jgi:hypothetical protein
MNEAKYIGLDVHLNPGTMFLKHRACVLVLP